jgi:hypothetical protein
MNAFMRSIDTKAAWPENLRGELAHRGEGRLEGGTRKDEGDELNSRRRVNATVRLT